MCRDQKSFSKEQLQFVREYELVNAQEESYVIKCLETVKDIDGIVAQQKIMIQMKVCIRVAATHHRCISQAAGRSLIYG